MAKSTSRGGSGQQEVADFRARQEEMLALSREYSQERLATWNEEIRSLQESWNGFTQGWQGSLGEMSALALNNFQEISASGAAAASLMSQTWEQALTGMSGQVDDWGENFLQTLQKVASAWMGSIGGSSGGGGSSWLGLVGEALDFGGLFHQGGVVTAHQGMVVSPGTLMGDEQLILAQSGEGILPRDAMARLGEDNFEALRRGRFELSRGSGTPQNHITIQVQSLDAAGVAGLDWGKLVQRHLLPVLQREMGRRW
jgi:lambda family phage tail tape measure protein